MTELKGLALVNAFRDGLYLCRANNHKKHLVREDETIIDAFGMRRCKYHNQQVINKANSHARCSMRTRKRKRKKAIKP